MSEREAFGPNLRRLRVKRGVSLESIAAATKVPTDLWAALERNDFTRWPAGIYARAYVRAYALEVGVDPDMTVDEFCRLFPNGDRRVGRVVREQAALVGHDLRWKDDLVGSITDEKRSVAPTGAPNLPAIACMSASRAGRISFERVPRRPSACLRRRLWRRWAGTPRLTRAIVAVLQVREQAPDLRLLRRVHDDLPRVTALAAG